MPIRNPEALEVKDEGATQGRVRIFDFVGTGVTASVSGQTATVTIAGGAGGGDSITINGVALVDADFDDATPAPPAGEVNVKWQKDASSPANVSASVQAATTAVKGVVELATDGEAAASVVVQGNDARMSDARTPLAHKDSHKSGGSDAFAAADLLEAVIKRIRTSTGPTDMVVGAVADGEFLRRVGATVIGAAPGAGSFVATQAIVSLPYPAKHAHRVAVADAAVSPSSKIVLSLAGVPDTQDNAGDVVDMLSMQAVPGSASFEFQANFLTPMAGPLTINYAVG